MHTTARLQLGLAGVLAALLLVAVVTALPESRAENWTPFAPHGWGAVGTAASLLMLSFIGWEAVSHLAGELRDPARQLPRAIFAALAIVVVLYLGLAIATIGVLGTAAPSRRPARRPDGRRPRRARPQRHRRPRRAAHDGHDERLRRGGRASSRARSPSEGSAPAALGRPRLALALFAGVGGRPARAARVRRDRRRRARARVQRGVRRGLRRRDRRRACGCSTARRACAAGVAFVAVAVVFAFSGVYLAVPVVVGAVALARRPRCPEVLQASTAAG